MYFEKAVLGLCKEDLMKGFAVCAANGKNALAEVLTASQEGNWTTEAAVLAVGMIVGFNTLSKGGDVLCRIPKKDDQGWMSSVVSDLLWQDDQVDPSKCCIRFFEAGLPQTLRTGIILDCRTGQIKVVSEDAKWMRDFLEALTPPKTTSNDPDFQAELSALIQDEKALQQEIANARDYISFFDATRAFKTILHQVNEGKWTEPNAGLAKVSVADTFLRKSSTQISYVGLGAVLAASICTFEDGQIACEIPEESEIVVKIKQMADGTRPCVIVVSHPTNLTQKVFLDLIDGTILSTKGAEWILEGIIDIFLL